MKNHRIAAGGILIKDDKILLVKYKNNESSSYLVAPGGAVEENENIKIAIKREILEETGILVEPISVIMIEDLNCKKFKMCKIWMNCKFISGEIVNTLEAKKEGICEVGWYSLTDLKNEIVYPSIIKNKNWNLLTEIRNEIEIPLTRITSF